MQATRDLDTREALLEPHEPDRDILPTRPAGRVILRRDALFRRTLAVVDVAAASVSIAVVASGSGTGGLRVVALVGLLPLVVLLNKSIGLYDRDEHVLRKTTLEETPLLLQVATVLALAAWLSGNVLVHGSLDRSQVLALGLLLLTTMLCGRAGVRLAIRTIAPSERCLILGDEQSANRLCAKLEHSPSVKATVVGRVELHADGAAPASRTEPPLLGDLRALRDVLDAYRVERVILVPHAEDFDEILYALRLIKALGVKVSVVPRLLEVIGSSAAFDEVDGINLLGVRRYGLTQSSEFLKRAVDFLVASLFVVALAPLLAMIALAIKLDSPGPVLFRQRRIGRAGNAFYIHKFRSMVRGAEAMKNELRPLNETQGLFKIANDPRVTRVGRLLRRTSLDELPQLINVLKGDMSLVGPRPLTPDEDAQIQGWQRRRLVLRPGMTGMWQIFGSARIPMNEMVKIDYLYAANWSLWQDVKILLRTAPFVLRRRGL